MNKIFILIGVVVLVIGLTVGITFAVWTEQADITDSVQTPVDDDNPSLQYIIFYGLDSNGEFTETIEDISSFAVVGYTGLVGELEIPSTYTANGVTKPVTHILIHEDHYENRLASHPIITSILIPQSVIYVGSGACMGMPLLTKVVLENSGESEAITINDMAFSACQKLEEFVSNEREINGDSSSYLKGTPLA